MNIIYNLPNIFIKVDPEGQRTCDEADEIDEPIRYSRASVGHHINEEGNRHMPFLSGDMRHHEETADAQGI